MFVQRLKELRALKEISQAALAEELGLSQQAIGKWETYKATPDPDMLVKLADFFHVTTDYLLGRTDNPHGVKVETIAAHRTDDPTKVLPPDAQKSLDDFKKYLYEKHGLKFD